MTKRIIYPLIAVVGMAAASGAAWWYQSKPTVAKEEKASSTAGSRPVGLVANDAAVRPAGVEVARVASISLQDDAQAVGSLRSHQSVMLRPEVAGRIKALGFRDGAMVRKDQVLVQLDDTLQQAELRQAQAQVSIAQANLKRTEELVAQNFLAQRVLDESQANVLVVEAQLALASARLARMAILAPFDGTVGLRNVNLGDFVKDGADLVNLEDTRSMYVDFRLPERYQGKLRSQQVVELALDAFPGRTFQARVEAIDPLIDANGRSVSVRAVLPNTMGEPILRSQPPSGGAASSQKTMKTTDKPPKVASAPLRPGMFARVTTVFSVNDAALVVPEEAIVPQGGRQFVIKVVEPSALPESKVKLPTGVQFISMKQEVKLGVRREGRVQITDGLTDGQTVVVAGQQRLQRDGTPLRIVELGRPAQAPKSAQAPSAAVSR